MGLWVDRIGEATDERRMVPLRILGQYAAVFIVSGSGWFASSTTGRLPVAANDVMLLFPDEPAHYAADASWRTLWILWNGAEAARLEECGYLHPKHPIVADRLHAVRQAHAELKLILELEGRDAILRRKIVVMNMIHLLYQASVRGRPQTDARINDAVQFLVERSAEPFSLPMTAARYHLSSTHFRRLFKSYTGVGPLQFVTAQRVVRAKELLAEGAAIKTAAAHAGFRDVFHFMRVFKKVAGITAGQFTTRER